MDSDLKQLFATFRRMGMLKFIQSDNFRNFLLDLDLDQEWDELKEVGSAIEYLDSDRYERIFMSFLDEIHANYDYENILSALVLDFAKWYPNKLDSYDIQSKFKDLGFSKRSLLDFQKDFRKIRDNKSEKISVVKSGILDKSKVFIVHGHDEISRLKLEKFVREDIGKLPIVLSDQESLSIETIISKLVRVANDCFVAIILFTPDDQMTTNQKRARQNVVFEFGYFLGRFKSIGNGEIMVIRQKDVEIPSDISGVLYYSYSESVDEVFYELSRKFKQLEK